MIIGHITFVLLCDTIVSESYIVQNCTDLFIQLCTIAKKSSSAKLYYDCNSTYNCRPKILLVLHYHCTVLLHLSTFSNNCVCRHRHCQHHYNTTYYTEETNQTTNDPCEEYYPTELLNSINPSPMPPHTFTLKVSIPIILIRSIKQDCTMEQDLKLILYNQQL